MNKTEEINIPCFYLFSSIIYIFNLYNIYNIDNNIHYYFFTRLLCHTPRSCNNIYESENFAVKKLVLVFVY